jgi:hypothetical protein
MVAIPLAMLLLFGAPQQSGKPPDLTSPQSLEQGRARYEAHRQAAIHIDELAGNIHSEADARAFVDAIAEQFTEHRYQFWTTFSIRRRVAHAEYAAVSDPSGLIPEQRIVDVWNEYVREIDAPAETLVTVAQVHNLRDAVYYSSQRMWQRPMQTLWTMPNVHAVDADGKVASGCRAVEALKVVYQMHESFLSLLSARERAQKGILPSELAAQRREQGSLSQATPVKSQAQWRALTTENPVRLAAYRYLQAHGESAYRQLLKRLFAELLPKE